MSQSTTTRLSLMMFLEYFVWGAWFPLLALHLDFLQFAPMQKAWVFGTAAIASVFALFAGGQIADRHLSSERLLAVSHLIAGVAMLLLALQKSFWPFFIVLLVHQLVYVPTLSVTNSIAFHNLKGKEREFGRVRLWGTIGWIAASWPFVFILQGKAGVALQGALPSIFVVAGTAALVLAAFSLTLPKTPPSTDSGEKNAPMEALKFLAVPAFGVLFLVTFLDALVHQCYFQYTSSFLEKAGLPGNWIMPAMSIGQIAEILTMASLAFFLKRLGWRTIMIFGILGHAARFFVFSLGEPVWLMVAVNVLHGFCYAFFFASVYIFVDEFFPKDSRASAQGLFNLLILGLGPFVGSQLWGYVEAKVSTRTPQIVDGVETLVSTVDFHRLFLYPAGLALIAAVLLLVFFHPPKHAESQAQ